MRRPLLRCTPGCCSTSSTKQPDLVLRTGGCLRNGLGALLTLVPSSPLLSSQVRRERRLNTDRFVRGHPWDRCQLAKGSGQGQDPRGASRASCVNLRRVCVRRNPDEARLGASTKITRSQSTFAGPTNARMCLFHWTTDLRSPRKHNQTALALRPFNSGWVRSFRRQASAQNSSVCVSSTWPR